LRDGDVEVFGPALALGVDPYVLVYRWLRILIIAGRCMTEWDEGQSA
jgi:hypothetical protein